MGVTCPYCAQGGIVIQRGLGEFSKKSFDLEDHDLIKGF